MKIKGEMQATTLEWKIPHHLEHALQADATAGTHTWQVVISITLARLCALLNDAVSNRNINELIALDEQIRLMLKERIEVPESLLG